MGFFDELIDNTLGSVSDFVDNTVSSISDGVYEYGDEILTVASVIPGPWQPIALSANAVNQASQGNVVGAIASAAGAYGTWPTTTPVYAGPTTTPGYGYGGGSSTGLTDLASDLLAGGDPVITSMSGGANLNLNDLASTIQMGSPGLTIEQAISVASAAAAQTGDGATWMDYLSTGLGLAQSANAATGGNNVDANAAQNATDPFAPYRGQYATQLNQLMANPSSVTSLPGYKFAQEQGQSAVERVMSARGKTVSSTEQASLNNQAQGLAGQYYNDQYNKLAQLSGASANPANGGTAYNTATAANQAQQQSGNQGLMQLVGQAATTGTPANKVVNGIYDTISSIWR